MDYEPPSPEDRKLENTKLSTRIETLVACRAVAPGGHDANERSLRTYTNMKCYNVGPTRFRATLPRSSREDLRRAFVDRLS
ncbi:hypothetical protein PPTG_22963 [Phytophthora nicotianae INRA-310]|uniref:Uncharacterized protein n=3 Tax=Phytophthora nicotianae TaxID=4792 RepID=W2Q7C6_PHYN3|nr:hypothetical protein PPTG_22963 [Phytophthora nicotianae INRA-310]ETI46557.1 hypothetical protein F443_09048 [Phytophthora nicotianae P1569]ETN08746.1 hypothetical protein PPTG_22963 [Phytophthora nicotianae INRA-310]ETO75257.1 hypothetical protein F444_09104 [Phytophthora nicotianae P1976]